jgi:histidine triad (HIT) family protein
MKHLNFCSFCNILTGKEIIALVYEDRELICFMDKYPINFGHILVVTKSHYKSILEVPYDQVCRLFIMVTKIAKVVVKVVKADGFHIGLNNGEDASQTISHLHVHIIPRFFNDSIKVEWPIRTKKSILELNILANKIRNKLEYFSINSDK